MWAETAKLKFPNISWVYIESTAFYMMTCFKVKSCGECKVYHPSQLVNKHYILSCSIQLSLMPP